MCEAGVSEWVGYDSLSRLTRRVCSDRSGRHSPFGGDDDGEDGGGEFICGVCGVLEDSESEDAAEEVEVEVEAWAEGSVVMGCFRLGMQMEEDMVVVKDAGKVTGKKGG